LIDRGPVAGGVESEPDSGRAPGTSLGAALDPDATEDGR
jgi:hypothetical protein